MFCMQHEDHLAKCPIHCEMLIFLKSPSADPKSKGLYAVMSCEIGGGNGLEPLAIGARMGLPVVDADFMGRAFPELQVTV